MKTTIEKAVAREAALVQFTDVHDAKFWEWVFGRRIEQGRTVEEATADADKALFDFQVRITDKVRAEEV